MPQEEYVWLPRQELLTFEEIARLVEVFTSLGVEDVRLTGGEPLLRRDLPQLVRMLAANPRIRDLALTTNGVLFAEQGEALRAAGLHRVTLSLDTLRPREIRCARGARHARASARGHRSRAAIGFSETEAGYCRAARRQRRRTRGLDRIWPRPRRRGSLHRVHGRRRRDANGRSTKFLPAPKCSSSLPSATGRSRRSTKILPRPQSVSGFRTELCSASSLQPRRRFAGVATAAA